jgi:hypothetical protein
MDVKEVPLPDDVQAFTCGPLPFVRHARTSLVEWGCRRIGSSTRCSARICGPRGSRSEIRPPPQCQTPPSFSGCQCADHRAHPAIPRKLSSRVGRLRLDGYSHQPANTIYLIGENHSRLVLLIVPVFTDPREAESILNAAADDRNTSTTGELLVTRCGHAVAPDDESYGAQQRWESEAGQRLGCSSRPDAESRRCHVTSVSAPCSARSGFRRQYPSGRRCGWRSTSPLSRRPMTGYSRRGSSRSRSRAWPSRPASPRSS